MKWMIRVDMEGLTGVVNMDQVAPGAPYYPFGLKMLKHDLQSVLDGLLADDGDEVWLYDIHFFGTNVDFDGLDPRVTAICGKPHYTTENMAFLKGGFDGMILLGLHAMADKPGSLLNHSYEHDIRSIVVRDRTGKTFRVGEIGLETLIAGEAGVPLAMVTADSDGCLETKELTADAVTVNVKESLGDTAAACYPPSITGRWLREGAAACRANAGKFRPVAAEGPVEIEMAFKTGELLCKLKSRIPDAFAADDRIILQGKSVIEAWHQYLVAKS